MDGLVRVRFLVPVGVMPTGTIWWLSPAVAAQLIADGKAEGY